MAPAGAPGPFPLDKLLTLNGNSLPITLEKGGYRAPLSLRGRRREGSSVLMRSPLAWDRRAPPGFIRRCQAVLAVSLTRSALRASTRSRILHAERAPASHRRRRPGSAGHAHRAARALRRV